MRKRLLSLMALAAVAMGINAQTWTKPTVTGVVEPYAVALEDHLTPSDDLSPSMDLAGAVYLYNVAGEGFLGGGNSWGTRASFKVASGGDNRPDLPYFIVDKSEDFNTSISVNPDEGEKAYWLYSPKSKNNYLLFRDDATNCWVDLGSQTHNGWFWRFEQNGKYYRIKSPKTHSVYGEDLYPNWENEYLGWNGKDDNNLISANIDPRVEGVGVDWLLINPEGYAAYNNAAPLVDARTALYKQAQIVVEEELSAYGINYEEYTEVYNGEDVAAINAAAKELAAKVVEARKTKAFAMGTEDNPSDVTFLLVNPNFNGSMDGWTIDVPGGQNKQYQSATYVNDAVPEDDPNYGVSISGFIEAWHPSNGLGNGKIYQQVELPMGKYVLGVDVMATNQVGTTLEESRSTVEGFQLYALGGGIDNGTDVRSMNGKPEHYEFEFITAGGTTELGLRMVNATGNWFGADNFTVKYKGNDIDPYYFALPALVETCENEIDVDANKANLDIKQAYNEAIETARGLVGQEEGDFEGAYKALNEAVDSLKASIAAYQKLEILVNRSAKDAEAYEKIESVNSQISGLLDDFKDGFEDEVATTAQIEEWVANYDAILLAAVKAALPEASAETPLLISVMGKNLDYAENSTEEGWTCSSSAYKVNYHNGEVWQASFSCLQTIENLPAGKYTVKAKAFYRNAPNADDYDLYVNGNSEVLTYLVANSNKQPVVDLAAAAVTELPEGSYYAETVQGNEETGEPGSGIWMPNSQQAAEWAFNNTDFFNCEVSTYLAQDGDLTFGTRNDDIEEANNQWSVWSQFEIYYLGKDKNALYEQVMALNEEAIDMQSNPALGMVEKGNDLLNEAISAAEAAQPTDSEETLTTIVNKLTEAMAYIEEGRELIDQLLDIVDIYSDKQEAESFDSSDEIFTDMYEAINEARGNESFESNEILKNWIDNLPAAWIGYVMGQDMSEASEENPFDITAILFNADLEDPNSTREQAPPYWDVDKLGQNNGFQNNNTYSNADASITLANFIESWTPSGYLADGKISQTLGAALPAGFYRLEADGKSSSSAVGVTLGVTDGEDTWSTPVASDEPTHWSVDFKSNGTSILTVGIFVKEANCTWIAFDNFTLAYIGQTAPTAVEGVEADVVATKPAAIYNLAGQRVSKAVRGLYIINGRKVVIK